MKDLVKAALVRLTANAMTPQDTTTLMENGVPMGALLDAGVQSILKKSSQGAMLSVEEIKALTGKGVNVEAFLGLKAKAAPTATIPAPAASVAAIPAPSSNPAVIVSSDPIERLDKKTKASFHAKARTRAIYAMRDGLRARGANISDEQHTDASAFAREETGLTASVLATLSKNGRPVNRTVGTEDALTAYRSALSDAGIVVSDEAYNAARSDALAAYEAFLTATRRIVTRALSGV